MKYPFSPEVLDALPEEIAQHFRELETSLLVQICEQLNAAEQMNEVSVQSIRALRSHGIDIEEIKKAITKESGLTEKQLDKLLDDVVAQNQSYYTELIDFAKLTQPEVLVEAATIEAIKTQCQREFGNITRSLGFLVDNGRTMLAPAKAYQWALDRAELEIQSGAVSYNQAIKNAVKQLAESGLKTVDYESGHVDQIDVASRRAVMTGVNQLCAKYTEQSAEFLKTPYYEVSAHAGARDVIGVSPWSSHKDWQGKVYSVNTGDIYPSIYEVCGLGYVDGLEGANCRHRRSPWVEGFSERAYSDEYLAHIDDGLGCEYDGKHYSAYEATQMQRRIERTIRKQKRLRDAYKAAGLTENAQAANIKLRRLNTKYKEFSKAAGLPEQRERLKVLYTDDKSKAAAESLKVQRAEEAGKLKAFWNSQKSAKTVNTAAPVEAVGTSAPPVSPPLVPKYTDVTAQWLEEATPNSHIVQDAQEYVKDGVTYKVDGHNVVLDYSKHEKEIAELLESKFGGELYMNPKVNSPQGIRVPDYQFRGKGFDLKTLSEKATEDTIFQRIKKSSGQTRNFVIDVTSGTNLMDKDVNAQIKKVFSHNDTKFVDEIIFVRDMQIICIVKRA